MQFQQLQMVTVSLVQEFKVAQCVVGSGGAFFDAMPCSVPCL